jgi:hypothetical protein
MFETLPQRLVAQLQASRCPDCACKTLRRGPRGGLSINVDCTTCGAGFNCSGGLASLAFTFHAQRLCDPTRPHLASQWRARAAYQDDNYPPRPCDHCRLEYRGPAVYCSLECALADA